LVSLDASEISDTALESPSKSDSKDAITSKMEPLSQQVAKLAAKEIIEWSTRFCACGSVNVDVCKPHMSYTAIVTENDSQAVHKMMAVMSGADWFCENDLPPTPSNLAINANYIIQKVWVIDPEFDKQIAE
ncbi:hypothetical protein BGZ98_002048, partial [Dissophora globulifera]